MSDPIELIKVGVCPVCGGNNTNWEPITVDAFKTHRVKCSKCWFYISKITANAEELVKIWNHLSVDQDYYEEERSKQE